MVIGSEVKQPGGDSKLDMEFDEAEDLTKNIDNLADHMDSLNFDEQFGKVAKQGMKRKLTIEEE